MRNVYRTALFVLLAAGIAACGKHGDISANDTTVLATVNGTPITSDMVRIYAVNRSGREPQSDEERKNFLNTLVDMEVLAQEAQKSGLASKPDVAAQLAISHAGLLAREQVQSYLEQHPVTPEQVKSAYDASLKSMSGRQYKARHILVANENDAKDIIAQLEKGADFGKLAVKYSKDAGSAVRGGDLGDWFSPDQMVPEFSSTLATLKKGEYTKQPVRSQYGWHVIQLEDERSVPPPSMDQMREKLTQQAESDAIESYINQLRVGANVKMTAAAPAAKPATAPAAAAATAAKH
jgi:peptidyl-prolyl cis-trans isomerase C